MTKKDYIMLANAIKETLEIEKLAPTPSEKTAFRTAVCTLINSFSYRAIKENPKFSKSKFWDMCFGKF